MWGNRTQYSENEAGFLPLSQLKSQLQVARGLHQKTDLKLLEEVSGCNGRGGRRGALHPLSSLYMQAHDTPERLGTHLRPLIHCELTFKQILSAVLASGRVEHPTLAKEASCGSRGRAGRLGTTLLGVSVRSGLPGKQRYT